MSGKPSRDKGCRFERSIVNAFKANDIEAKRVPLSGAADGFKGDVLVEGKGKTYRLELKARQSGFKQLYGWLDGNDALVVKADRQEALVILPLSEFINLIAPERQRQEDFTPSRYTDSAY